MTNISNNKSWFKTSITARMLMVGFLILVLMVPLVFIRNLIEERANRQEEVISDINAKWGKELLVSGPVLKVPYNYYTEVVKLDHEIKYAYFFPETLSIASRVNAFKKKYGIYDAAVFTSKMNFTGSFPTIDFADLDIKEQDVLWEKATFIIQTSNLKGIKESVEILIDKNAYSFVPRYKEPVNDNYASLPHLNELESIRVDEKSLPISAPINFSFDLTVNGSEQLQFIPIGKETNVTVNSNWQHPSFQGSFLPDKKEGTEDSKNGFHAEWNVLQALLATLFLAVDVW